MDPQGESHRRDVGKTPSRSALGSGAGLSGLTRRAIGMLSQGRQQGECTSDHDRLTDRALRAVSLAHEEAACLKHNHTGTEHLLLGLLREGGGVAAKVLAGVGLELDRVRAEVEHAAVLHVVTPEDKSVLTTRASVVLELAAKEADRFHHAYIDTEHLLLGVLDLGEGTAITALEKLGVDTGQVRAEVERAIEVGEVREVQPDGPRKTVITVRLSDRAVDAIDALVQTGIRSTRSDAAAWLIGAGIEAQRPLFERVYATVEQIRQLRSEAQTIAERAASEGS